LNSDRIAASLVFEGKIQGAGDIRIAGQFKGDIDVQGDLTIETGAKLTIEGSIEGLHLKEFFLLLSSTGLAYRRCELAWVNGDQIGVIFLKQSDKKKKPTRRGATQGAEV